MSTRSDTVNKPAPTDSAPIEPNYVTCKVCLAEIPESVAMSSEADDYTQHFCGIECYTRWHEETEKAED